MFILATKSDWFLIKWVAEVLGLLMNGLYTVLEKISVPNIGLAIILFTALMYLLMTPLTVRQQRFTKLNAMMQPEIQKIQDKYKGKTDNISRQKMMDEQNAVYEKYGVSPTGSCVQLLIQMPIMFALYQVIYKIPGYIESIGNTIRVLAEDSVFVTAFQEFVAGSGDNTLIKTLGEGATENVIDAVYRLNTSQWTSVLSYSKGTVYESALQGVYETISKATSFLGLNISDAPMTIITSAWKTKTWIMIFVAILIPVLAWASQVVSMRIISPTAKNKKGEAAGMGDSTMKSMNTMMPLMSAVFCFTLPVGIGIYWIVGAVVRGIQSYFINKKLEKEGLESIMQKAREKAQKKREKKGVSAEQINRSARTSTRNLAADREKTATELRNERLQRLRDQDTGAGGAAADPDSIAAKANMVQRFNEKNAKGKKR